MVRPVVFSLFTLLLELHSLGMVRSHCGIFEPCAWTFSDICRCDENCPMYDDCCAQSVFQGNKKRHTDASCVHPDKWTDSPYWNIYVKGDCPKFWKRHDSIRRACEWNYTDMEDLYARLPVTNPHTQMTYKNYFCAICNNDTRSSLPWKIKVACPSLVGYILRYGNLTYDYHKDHLTYSRTRKAWGVWLYGGGEKAFYPCDVSLLADDLRLKTRPCHPDLVSDCAATWKLEDVREKCLSYMQAVDDLLPFTTYRNIHCAICNYEDLKPLFGPPKPCYLPVGPPSPFTVLLDVNKICTLGEGYDNSVKICRSEVCLPGETLKDGECLQDI